MLKPAKLNMPSSSPGFVLGLILQLDGPLKCHAVSKVYSRITQRNVVTTMRNSNNIKSKISSSSKFPNMAEYNSFPYSSDVSLISCILSLVHVRHTDHTVCLGIVTPNMITYLHLDQPSY
jgi:hypothetical protein